jgi:hypothetical protein
MSYGLPGLPGYDYARPLDYFDFEASFLSTASNPVENVMIRGLLIGRKTADRARSRGIWGLYGSYDYISPYSFRVSSTAVSLGTTRQYWLIPGLALQGSMLGGVGYGAAGSTTVIPSTPTNAAIRDYHFGVTPQALLAVRLIAGDRATLDVAARSITSAVSGQTTRAGRRRSLAPTRGLPFASSAAMRSASGTCRPRAMRATANCPTSACRKGRSPLRTRSSARTASAR